MRNYRLNVASTMDSCNFKIGHCFRLMSNKNTGHAVTFQKFPIQAASNRWQQSSACEASRPPAKHVPPCRPTTLENAIRLIAWSCLWNEFSTCSYIFPKSAPELLNRFLHAPFNLPSLLRESMESKSDLKVQHTENKNVIFFSCSFLLFAKFYLPNQTSLLLFLILVVILSFRPTANANTIFFRH